MQKAPTFSLQDRTGTTTSLESITSPFIVLFFYPKDDTPGCTVEAIEFTADQKEIEALGATIIGISGGTNKTKEKFCSKHNLTITLLSDPDFAVSKLYNAYGEKSFMGRKFLGIHRKTFILDQDRMIVKEFEKVTPKGHSQEVIEALKENGNHAAV